MTRSYCWPLGHWDWYRHLAFKHGIRVGSMIFVGGQVDKTERGDPLNAFDLARQTSRVVKHIDTVLRGFGAGIGDLTKLTAYYVNDGGVDEPSFLADIGRHLIALGDGQTRNRLGPVLTAVPLPCLALPGMMVEIEAIAMRGEDAGRLDRVRVNPPGLVALPPPFCHGLRCGPHAWLSAQSARDARGKVRAPGDALEQTPLMMAHIGDVLEALGLELADAVKVGCWYRGDGTRRTWASAAGLRAARFAVPGPVSTELPTACLPAGETARMDVWAMRGAEGDKLHRETAKNDRGLMALPYSSGLRCGNMIFTGGHLPVDDNGTIVHPSDLNEQTRAVMESTRRTLEGLGAGLDHMVKQTSFYLGGADPKTIVTNQTLRSSYYTEPAGASTGVPLPFFAVEDVMVTVETIAMLD